MEKFIQENLTKTNINTNTKVQWYKWVIGSMSMLIMSLLEPNTANADLINNHNSTVQKVKPIKVQEQKDPYNTDLNIDRSEINTTASEILEKSIGEYYDKWNSNSLKDVLKDILEQSDSVMDRLYNKNNLNEAERKELSDLYVSVKTSLTFLIKSNRFDQKRQNWEYKENIIWITDYDWEFNFWKLRKIGEKLEEKFTFNNRKIWDIGYRYLLNISAGIQNNADKYLEIYMDTNNFLAKRLYVSNIYMTIKMLEIEKKYYKNNEETIKSIEELINFFSRIFKAN